MGIFSKNNTHGSRSSSMSYVMQWRPKNIRQVIVIGLAIIAIATIVLIWVNGHSKKSVYLVVDGTIQKLETSQASVKAVLDEQNVNLKAEDKLSIPLTDAIKDGDRIVVERAIPVVLTFDGTTKTHYTTQGNVEGAIKEIGVKVNPEDKITPDLTTALSADMNIRVVRVDRRTSQTKEQIPFTIVKTSDPKLTKGKTKILAEGAKGVVTHNIEKVYEDGVFVSKRWLGKEVHQPAQTKVIAVGTKPEPKTEVLAASISRNDDEVDINSSGAVNKGGVSFKYKKLLKNVQLTAYSSQEDGIGTKTASGNRVKEGRTIAVDKSLVPLGWWVYIEGLGFRRAEDTGGAIKGKIMDVYYDSLKDVKNFGRKKGRTVYVIGPNKPELN